jgi:hypothetical protein
MNEISGMNSVARGAPEANISSGTFAALMLNIAEKFVSATEMSLDALRNANGSMLLELLRANCETEFVAEVAGSNQAPYLRTFKPADFNGVKRVQIRQRSPLLDQIPGRFEVFNAIKDLDKTDRQAAVQLLTTGNADAFTEADQSCSLLIQWENEQLAKGEWCEPSPSDDVLIHNPKHKAYYDKLRTNPNADPQVLMAFQEHMSKHALVWYGSDPTFCQSLGLPTSPLFAGIQPPQDDAAGGGGASKPVSMPGQGQSTEDTPLPNAAQAPASAQQQGQAAAA